MILLIVSKISRMLMPKPPGDNLGGRVGVLAPPRFGISTAVCPNSFA